MEINTKFNIHDDVHFIDNEKILYGKIIRIIFDKDDSEKIIFVYKIECCNGYIAYITEKDIFQTYEEAEQRLKEIENTEE